MYLKNSAGRIIAELRFREGVRHVKDRDATVNASIFSVMRSIPREFLQVDVRYFGIGFDSFIPLSSFKGINMDIQAALRDTGNEPIETPAPVDQPRKMLFVSPSADKSPDDGVLTYSTLETVFDIADIPERSVITFRPDQLPLLRCLCDNDSLFGLELRALTGLPETDYSADFDNAVWALDKVAYVPFISELRLASELDSQLQAQNETGYDRERVAYTRKSGEVKEHSNFKVATPLGIAAEGEDDEEMAL